MEAVDEVESERDENDEAECESLHGAAQACFKTMLSTMSEMFSIALTDASIASTMSFHLRTANALNSPEKRCATDRR